MKLYELWITALALAMDAVAAAICQGAAMGRFRLGAAAKIALYFGICQALMPLVGWVLGSTVSRQIQALDHWVAFGLLGALGMKMLWDSRRATHDPPGAVAEAGTLLLLAVATSIDALAVGVALACLAVPMAVAVTIIGGVTFGLSLAGVWMGTRSGGRLHRHAGVWGGVILMLIGTKILLEHLTRHT